MFNSETLYCSDHSLLPGETKKKKERRKDKDNASLESSEDDVPNISGRNTFLLNNP